MFVLLLCLTFLWFFGYPGMKMYLKRSVVLQADKKQAKDLKFPAIKFCPDMADAWKDDITNPGTTRNIQLHCNKTTVQDTIKCIDEKTHPFEDIIVDAFTNNMNSTPAKESILDSKYWSSDFSQSEFGKCFTFIYPSIRKKISLSEAPVFNFILNSNISHRIFIHDPQYFMLMVNPSTFPRIERSIARPEINHMSVMQYITVKKHIKKKRSNHLCNDDSDYDFLVCVKQHIADTIGCKPEWENISKDVPNCTTLDQLNEHDATYINLSIINTREVFEKTKCLSPCRFKVCIRSIEPNYPFLMSSMTGIG